MTVRLIMAQDLNGGIGLNGDLPWHIPAELKHFAKTTKGAAMLVGSKTWESMSHIDLKDRTVYVVTSKADQINCARNRQLGKTVDPRITYVKNPIPVIEAFQSVRDDLFVIGGCSLYESCRAYCEYFHLTTIEATYETDTQIDILADLNVTNIYHRRKIHEADPEAGTPEYRTELLYAKSPKCAKAELISETQYHELVDLHHLDDSEVPLEHRSEWLSTVLVDNYIVIDPNDRQLQLRKELELSKKLAKVPNDNLRAAFSAAINKTVAFLPELPTHITFDRTFVYCYNRPLKPTKRNAWTNCLFSVADTEPTNCLYLVFDDKVKSIPRDILSQVVPVRLMRYYGADGLNCVSDTPLFTIHIVNLPTRLHQFVRNELSLNGAVKFNFINLD